MNSDEQRFFLQISVYLCSPATLAPRCVWRSAGEASARAGASISGEIFDYQNAFYLPDTLTIEVLIGMKNQVNLFLRQNGFTGETNAGRPPLSYMDCSNS
jgi:hypothetical protein